MIGNLAVVPYRRLLSFIIYSATKLQKVFIYRKVPIYYLVKKTVVARKGHYKKTSIASQRRFTYEFINAVMSIVEKLDG